MPKIVIREASIVFLAGEVIRENNDLRSTFVKISDYGELLRNKIIPDYTENLEWGIDPAYSGGTLPFHNSTFLKNGVSITGEEHKLTITDNNFDHMYNPVIVDMANKIVNTYDINLKAVGINFIGIVKKDDPKSFIKNHFLNDNIKSKFDDDSKITDLKFSFNLDIGCKLSLSLVSGLMDYKYKEKIDKIEGIIITANFHSELNEKNKASDITKETELYDSKLKILKEKIDLLFGD